MEHCYNCLDVLILIAAPKSLQTDSEFANNHSLESCDLSFPMNNSFVDVNSKIKDQYQCPQLGKSIV